MLGQVGGERKLRPAADSCSVVPGRQGPMRGRTCTPTCKFTHKRTHIKHIQGANYARLCMASEKHSSHNVVLA